ncbi:methyltransferase domain-containing protein [Candidatus Peregrinibacteria bacterium]|nr:methyltransferase domain-containing protein [Candidatus Peregrinibacteria bacterium]
MGVIYAILLILALTTLIAWISLAPWVPTKIEDLPRINRIANLKPGQTFFEIGCGNGRVCTYIAKKNPNCKVIGIEYAIAFFLYTKFRNYLLGPKNLKIIFGDALKYKIRDVDVIYIFGLKQTVNGKIKKKLLKEMSSKSKFLSYVFSINSWPGYSKTYKKNEKTSGIHVYKISNNC